MRGGSRPWWLRWLQLDALLAFASYVGLMSWMSRRLRPHLHEVVALGSASPAPVDFNGTLWFYWWFHRATVDGRPFLWTDAVCAPGGEPLGTNFPNRIDAWLALPFFHYFPFPANYNLFVLSLPVVGAIAGYLGLRAVTPSRLLAWGGGLVFGFNAYTMSEVRAGRPVTGLVFVLPLFAGAWLMALRARGRIAVAWTVLAGALGALAVNDYLPFALWLALFALVTGVARLFVPAPGIPRRRPLWAVPLAALLGALLSAPYVHEVLFVRQALLNVGGQQATPETEPKALWDPTLWSDLSMLLEKRGRFSTPAASGPLTWDSQAIQRVQSQSLSLDHLWGFTPGEVRPGVWMSPIFLAGVALLSCAAGWRGLAWFGLAVLFWLLSLGPYATWNLHTSFEPVLAGGQRWRLPTWWLLSALPPAIDFLRPYRAFPMVLMCLAFALTASIQCIQTYLRKHTKKNAPLDDVASPGSHARSLQAALKTYVLEKRHLLALPMMIALLLSILQVRHVLVTGGFRLPTAWWQPHPFMLELARQPDPVAIAELPAGLGHATALFQLVHQKRRSEGHHDAMPPLFDGQPPPNDCYQLPFLRTLWWLGRPDTGADPQRDAGLAPEAIREARQSGFRYVVLYPEMYEFVKRDGLEIDMDLAVSALETTLGAPIVRDGRLIVFELRTTDAAPPPGLPR